MAAAAARRVTAALSTQRERTSGAADGGGNSTRMTPRVRQPLDYTLFLAAAARARSIVATATDCFTGRSIIKSHAASGRETTHFECAVAAAMAHRVTAALVPLPLVCTLIPAATAHASIRMRAMTTDCCMSAHACQSRDAVGRAAQTSAALKGAETHGRPQRYY